MTPERAGEIATEFRRSHGLSSTADCPIRLAILQACAEEREYGAELMDEAADDVAGWGAYASEYFQEKHKLADEVQKWRNRANAIRGAE